LLFGADLGFHEEWLRDEPCEATTTGSGVISRSPGVNSHPETGDMRFGVPAVQHLVLVFPPQVFPAKRFGILRLVPQATESE
jgi:hypothetical protein